MKTDMIELIFKNKMSFLCVSGECVIIFYSGSLNWTNPRLTYQFDWSINADQSYIERVQCFFIDE